MESSFETASKPQPEFVYADLKYRIGAAIIDSIVLIPINLLIQYDIIYVKKLNIMIVGTILALLYKPLMEGLNNGRTIGKRMMKLQVVDNNLQGVSVSQAFLRSCFVLMFGLGMLLAQYLLFQSAEFLSITDPEAFLKFIQNATILNRISLVNYLVLFVDAVFLITNLQRLSLHDLIANTVVIRKVKQA